MNANLCAGAIWTWREGVSCSTHWGAEPESVSAHSVGSSAWWAYSVENALSIIRWNVSIKIKEMLIPVCFSGFCVARKLRTAAELKHLSHIRHIFFFNLFIYFFYLCLLFFSTGGKWWVTQARGNKCKLFAWSLCIFGRLSARLHAHSNDRLMTRRGLLSHSPIQRPQWMNPHKIWGLTIDIKTPKPPRDAWLPIKMYMMTSKTSRLAGTSLLRIEGDVFFFVWIYGARPSWSP